MKRVSKIPISLHIAANVYRKLDFLYMFDLT